MVYGWLIPCIFVMFIAACLAELTSSMPCVSSCLVGRRDLDKSRFRTSAGLYYFSAKLAPPKWAPLASWITGWANVTGQVTLVCSIDFTWCVRRDRMLSRSC